VRKGRLVCGAAFWPICDSIPFCAKTGIEYAKRTELYLQWNETLVGNMEVPGLDFSEFSFQRSDSRQVVHGGIPGPQVRGTLRQAQGRLGGTLSVVLGRRDRGHPPRDFAPALRDGGFCWNLTQDCAALILHPNTQRPRAGDPGSWAIIASPYGRKSGGLGYCCFSLREKRRGTDTRLRRGDRPRMRTWTSAIQPVGRPALLSGWRCSYTPTEAF
jgi:hypothetical protein